MNNDRVEFFVPGIGRPKGSKRLGRTPTGRTILLEDSKREKPWSESVGWAAAVAMQGRELFVATPLLLMAVFGFPRPRSHYERRGSLREDAPRWHTKKPDASKLVRSVEDALKGIVWDDDSRVAQLIAVKMYADRCYLPGVAMRVVPADDLDLPAFMLTTDHGMLTTGRDFYVKMALQFGRGQHAEERGA